MPEKEFHIKQKFTWISDDYKIKDKLGQTCYNVKGNPKKLGTQASFMNTAGVELAALKQTKDTKLSPWKKFIVEKDGKPWALAKQDDWGALSKKTISIDIPGENDYQIVGDRMSWEFDIMKGDQRVGQVSKKWGWTDCYGVRVVEGADEVDVLLCGILIDAVYHDDDDGGQGFH